MALCKRELAAAILRKSGVLYLMERLGPRRPCLMIVNYHRIGDPTGSMLDDGVFDATPEAFEAQIRYLRDHFEIVGLDDLLATALNAFDLRRPSAMVTFDDGYCDNSQIALPILGRLGVTATFFLPTQYIGQNRLPWWDRIAYVVKATKEIQVVLDYPAPLAIDFGQTGRLNAIRVLLRLYKNSREIDEDRFFQHLHDRTQVSLPQSLASDLFMSWDDVRQLLAEGMSVGSHTHSHSLLSQLSDTRVSEEFTFSKQMLEDELGQSITAIAYPVGGTSECSNRIKYLAREAGYRVGFSYGGGVNYRGHEDLFDINRVGVDGDMSFTLFRVRSMLFSRRFV
jgi:peptidoglycan/xylan/chitin deacetylase (PgdA/CDA1 family)